jgi:hypothetical protein
MKTPVPKHIATTAVAAAALAFATPDFAFSQDLEPPRSRQGYYLGLGLLGAVDHNRDHGQGLGAWPGWGIGFGVGQLVTRRFGLGFMVDGGATASGSQRASLGKFGVEAQWELARHLAVRGGVGLGFASLTDTGDEDAKARATVGAGYTLGLSYDWFLTRDGRSGGWALSPQLLGRLVPGSTLTAAVLMAGFGLTWWTGRPANQLELPAGQGYARK